MRISDWSSDVCSSDLCCVCSIMRIILQLVGAMVLFVGCGVDRQAKALRALEKCQYAFVSADSVSLAGTDENKLVANGRGDIRRLPGVALGLLSRDLPLSGFFGAEERRVGTGVGDT